MSNPTNRIAAAVLAAALMPWSSADGADPSPAAAQLEQDAGTYVKAMASGAPRERVDALHARFVLTQRLSARMGARDLVTDRACFYPELEGRRTGKTGRQVLVRDCFGLDPMKALVSARYYR